MVFLWSSVLIDKMYCLDMGPLYAGLLLWTVLWIWNIHSKKDIQICGAKIFAFSFMTFKMLFDGGLNFKIELDFHSSPRFLVTEKVFLSQFLSQVF